jgi:hypothetical protein
MLDLSQKIRDTKGGCRDGHPEASETCASVRADYSKSAFFS